MRRGNGALDDRDVIRALYLRTRGLEEVGNLQALGEHQQLILAVDRLNWQPSQEENFQTASVGVVRAGRSQFPDRQPGLEVRSSDRPDHRGISASARAGNVRTGRSRIACCAPSRRRHNGADTRSRERCEGEAHHHLGPAHSAAALARSKRARATRRGTAPTCPSHSGPALSTITATSRPRAGQRSSSSAYSSWSGERPP